MDDYAQIRQLYADYCWTLDDRQYEEWLRLFTEDGVVEGPNYGRHVGHPELRHFIAKYKATTGMFQVRHLVNNVRVSKSRATPPPELLRHPLPDPSGPHRVECDRRLSR